MCTCACFVEGVVGVASRRVASRPGQTQRMLLLLSVPRMEPLRHTRGTEMRRPACERPLCCRHSRPVPHPPTPLSTLTASSSPTHTSKGGAATSMSVAAASTPRATHPNGCSRRLCFLLDCSYWCHRSPGGAPPRGRSRGSSRGGRRLSRTRRTSPRTPAPWPAGLGFEI